MKISLSRLLTLFLVGISALPAIAMAVLILMMNSDIRSIAEAEFDRMDERNARRLAADNNRTQLHTHTRPRRLAASRRGLQQKKQTLNRGRRKFRNEKSRQE